MMHRLAAQRRRMARSVGDAALHASKAANIRAMRATPSPRRWPPRACALLARSFKYHRPRSILSFANHDSNTLFQVDGVPNVRGDVTLLRDGMRVSALNTFGGLAHDKARVLDRFARLLAGGLLLQGVSLQAAVPALGAHVPRAHGLGLGESRRRARGHAQALWILRRAGDRRRARADSSAALAAAEAGAQVALVDESLRLEGNGADRQHLRSRAVHDSQSIAVHAATVAAGYYADHWVALVEPASHDEDARQGGGVRNRSDRTARGVPQ